MVSIKKLKSKLSGIGTYIVKHGKDYFKIKPVSQQYIKKVTNENPDFKKFFI